MLGLDSPCLAMRRRTRRFAMVGHAKAYYASCIAFKVWLPAVMLYQHSSRMIIKPVLGGCPVAIYRLWRTCVTSATTF